LLAEAGRIFIAAFGALAVGLALRRRRQLRGSLGGKFPFVAASIDIEADAAGTRYVSSLVGAHLTRLRFAASSFCNCERRWGADRHCR
jgi:hypothetical protein